VGLSRFLRTLGLTVVFGASAAALPRLAHADEPSSADRATARTLAQEGYVALRDKDYATAADRFGRALVLVHAPTLLRDLARAQVGLGKLVDAHENYSLIIREGVAPDAPQPWQQALADAKAEIVAIPPRLPWITITVTGPADPMVSIDGVNIASASLGVKRPADPGKHEIRAAANGFYTAKKTIVLEEGESVNVTFELEEAPPDAPPEPQDTAPPPVSEAPAAEPAWRTPALISAFAVGGAGLALGGITGALALGKHSKLSTDCSGGVCGREQKDDLDSYHTLGTLSTIGFVAGGVGAAAGVVLLLVKPHSTTTGTIGAPRQRRVKLQVTPFVGIASAGLEGTF
jgi:hypothetical protein